MSVESLAIALHHSRAKGTAKLVLIGIANHDGDGGAWPSVATLARYANVSRQNVQKALGTLEELHEIRRHISQGGDHSTADYQRPNLYELTVRCPDDCDRSKHHRTRRTRSSAPLFEPASETRPGLADEAPPASEVRRPPASVARPKPSKEPDLKKLPNVTTDACPRVRAGGQHLLDDDGFCIACLTNPTTGRTLA